MKLKNYADEDLCAEVARRVKADSWTMREHLNVHLYEADLRVADLEPDGPRRLWLYGKGEWAPDRWTRWAMPLFLSCDEYMNSLICLRLPRGRLLLLALNVPLNQKRCIGDGEDA